MTETIEQWAMRRNHDTGRCEGLQQAYQMLRDRLSTADSHALLDAALAALRGDPVQPAAITPPQPVFTVTLTEPERVLLQGIVGNYRRLLLLDLRKGVFGDMADAQIRADEEAAGDLLAKLGGGA